MNEWEAIGVVGVDAAPVAFGDAARIAPGWSLDPDAVKWSARAEARDLAEIGVPMVACLTMVDMDLPVEVLRDSAGVAVAARIRFTDDMDDLPGDWVPAGELDISGGRCLACDPFCPPKEYYRLEFAMANGHYLAEVFEYGEDRFGTDLIGLRIRREDFALPTVQDRPPAHGPISAMRTVP